VLAALVQAAWSRVPARWLGQRTGSVRREPRTGRVEIGGVLHSWNGQECNTPQSIPPSLLPADHGLLFFFLLASSRQESKRLSWQNRGVLGVLGCRGTFKRTLKRTSTPDLCFNKSSLKPLISLRFFYISLLLKRMKHSYFGKTYIGRDTLTLYSYSFIESD
jgi:hypothetical protein